MDNVLIGFIVGAVLSTAVCYLYFRAYYRSLQDKFSQAKTNLTEQAEKLQDITAKYQTIREEKAGLEVRAARIPELENRIGQLQTDTGNLIAEISRYKQQVESEGEKLQWLEKAQETLRESFESLSGKALRENSDEFLKRAREQMDNVKQLLQKDWGAQKDQIQHLVTPLEESLQNLNKEVRELEQKREGAYSGMSEQIKQLQYAQQQMYDTTNRLEQALKSPTVRGSWGQFQLRRVVELAGMEQHVAFDEQTATESGRPDMTIRLPNRSILPVDAKAPMSAYLDAMDTNDSTRRQSKLREHSAAVKSHVRALSQKRYWEQFERAPEFVVMFVPNDSCLSAAFEHDPNLLEYAFQQKVLLTTPVTLLALLKAVAYGWQQQQIAENARQIAEAGKELYDRLSKFVEYLQKTGKGLDGAVRSYNEAIGSLENRLLPSARRFKDLGAVTSDLPDIEIVERHTRELPAVDVTDDVQKEGVE